jgi:hypothetical protein
VDEVRDPGVNVGKGVPEYVEMTVPFSTTTETVIVVAIAIKRGDLLVWTWYLFEQRNEDETRAS